MRPLRSLLILVIALAATLGAQAQSAPNTLAPYKFDFGGSIGMSGYIGDANASNPFKHPGFAADIAARYLLDSRWAFKAAISTYGLSGNTGDIANVLPDDTYYEFTSQVYDLTVRAEFNFFNYGIGETYKRLRRWSPYLAIGIGLTLAASDGNTAIAPSIPMTFGIRYKLKERINLHAEFTMAKIFSDHVDGKDIADLNRIETDFYKNTDWTARIAIGISYEFGKRCETCHYVD